MASKDTPMEDVSKDKKKSDAPAPDASKDSEKQGYLLEKNKDYDPTAPLVEKENPGPAGHQVCTDCLCVALFGMFWIGLVLLGGLAFQAGNPARLTNGIDMYGAICGVNNTLPLVDMTSKPVLVFPNKLTLNVSYCAAKCPEILQLEFDIVNFAKANALCPYYPSKDAPDGSGYITPEAHLFPGVRLKVNGSVPPDAESFIPAGLTLSNIANWPELIRAYTESVDYEVLEPNMFPFNLDPQPCYFSYITKEVQGRCFPSLDNLEVAANQTGAASNSYVQDTLGIATKLMSDVVRARFYILGCSMAGFAFAFLWLGILNHFAKAFIYMTIFLVFVLLLAATILGFVSWNERYQAGVSDPSLLNDSDYDRWTKAYLGLSIVFAILTLAHVCLVAFIFRSLQLALELMDEASAALRYCWQILVSPAMTMFCLTLNLIWFFGVWACIETAGTTVVDSTGEFKGYEPDDVLRGMRYYLLYGFFWTNNVIIGLQQMSMAGTIAMWYYSPKVEKEGGKNTSKLAEKLRFPLWVSIKNTLLYHFGTVCFGAALIAIVQFIQYFVDKVRSQIEGKDSPLRIFLCILKCVVCCLEKVLKFISKNAYIVTALTGHRAFLGASKDAFFLLLANARHLMVVRGVSAFLLFLGKLFVTVACGVLAGSIMRADPGINYWMFPTLIVVVIAYFVGGYFMEVYQMTIDTIFICLCWDMKMASKGDEKYTKEGNNWVPGDLEEFVNDKAKNGKKGGCIIL